MKENPIVLMIAGVLLFTGCGQSPVGEMQFPEGTVQHVVHAGEVEWKPCPPHLPEGCEITVLEGDPKSTELFTVRFNVREGFVMAPHTHPKDERVTVIEGKVSVAFGLDGTHETATHFGPGDYYINKRDAIHTVWADTDCILQITGIGPWEANFVETEESAEE